MHGAMKTKDIGTETMEAGGTTTGHTTMAST